jgi:glycosyltransferase involved in cell wall biosynthesis
MSKRVLLIAEYYYPSNAAGAHRPAKLAKYLPQFGWFPTVLCADIRPGDFYGFYDKDLAARADVCRTVRVPSPSLGPKWKRAILRAEWRLWPYKAPILFTRKVMAAAEALAADRPFDAVWSSYGPAWAHTVAGRLAAGLGIPWVADFRDLPDETTPNATQRKTVKEEVRVCASASALVTVSDALAERLRTRHGVPVHVISNGFDRDDYPAEEAGKSDLFTIDYYGIVYSSAGLVRDPSPLFAALDMLVARGEIDPEKVRVRFFGTDPEALAPWVGGYRCKAAVEAMPRVPYPEMVRLVQRSVVLLLLSTPGAKGIATSKLFEYLGAGRPILNVPGDGDVVDRIVAATQAGATAGDPEAIARVVKTWYDEWRQTGWVAGRSIPEEVARYSRRGQAGQLAAILDSLTA